MTCLSGKWSIAAHDHCADEQGEHRGLTDHTCVHQDHRKLAASTFGEPALDVLVENGGDNRHADAAEHHERPVGDPLEGAFVLERLEFDCVGHLALIVLLLRRATARATRLTGQRQ